MGGGGGGGQQDNLVLSTEVDNVNWSPLKVSKAVLSFSSVL